VGAQAFTQFTWFDPSPHVTTFLLAALDEGKRFNEYASAAVILNILARQRDPCPPVAILTPAALTLRHSN
jgi:hypothetical protein